MESESPIIIQMLKNVKQIVDVSKARGCWSPDELEGIKKTYHNVSEILKQLQERDERFEEIKEDAKQVDESVEIKEEMEEID